MNKKVSIVIPTYGRNDLISKAIESVVVQTYSNKEIIVIDDNVDEVIADNTRNIALSFKSQIDIKYFKNSNNIGGALSRNEGVKFASGEYISFLDDDDFFAPEKLSKQIAFMETFGHEVSLCNMIVVDENGSVTNKLHRAQCKNVADFLLRGVAMTPMIIVKRTSAINAGLFDNVLRFQDHLFVINLIKSGCSIGVLDEALVYYFEHSSPRITNSNKSGLGYEARFDKEKELFHLLNKDEKRSVLLRQDIIRSKTISIEFGSFRSLIFLFSKLVKVRNISDFVLWNKTLIRNIIRKNKRF